MGRVYQKLGGTGLNVLVVAYQASALPVSRLAAVSGPALSFSG